MTPEGKVVIVTGGASGIGRALALRLRHAGAAAIVVADLDGDCAAAVAAEVGGLAVTADVRVAADVSRLVAETERRFGRVDLYCSNAGVSGRDADFEDVGSAADEVWERNWRVNVMAHVHAARACLPAMRSRGQGYFLITASAAGLLSQVGSAPYATTKHAAVGFAESLAITHREHGVRVSVLCPQAVDTPMIQGATGAQGVDGVLSPDAVAEAVVTGLEAERFLILPHPQVETYMRRKAEDYDRWIAGMVRLRARTAERNRAAGPPA